MKIELRFRGIESTPTVREHAVRSIHYHLSRFGPEVTGVVVRLDDVNGPKGGADKRCQITVGGPRFGSLTLDDSGGDPQSALELAMERVARSVGRALERSRSIDRSVSPLRRAS